MKFAGQTSRLINTKLLKMSNFAVKYGPEGTGYISTPSFAIPNTGILTIEAWMKSKDSATVAQSIIGDGAENATVGFIEFLRDTSSNKLLYYYAQGVVAAFPFNNFFTDLDNQWIHIVTVADYTNKTLKAYRNGVQFGTTQSLSGTPVFPSTNRAKYIGAYSSSVLKLTDGSLDEVRIYNRGLSAEEVKEHYNGIFKDESGLQLYYDFNEDSGTTVLDKSGNGRNGTMKGSTSRETFPPQIRGSITNVQGVESITF